MKTQTSRWARLVLGCVILLLAGVIYAWSILKSPLAKEFGWTKAQLSLCFTFTLSFFCLGGLFSGLLSKRLSIRVRMLAAAVLILGGFDLAGNLSGGIWLMYLAYGVMAGTGIGIVYNVVISATNAWFPDKKGLCSGALMMSFGFSALVLGKLADWLFALAGFGWRNTYMLLGSAIGVCVAAAAFLVKMPSAQARADAKHTQNDVDTREMLKRASFWKLFAFFALLAAVGSTAISFGKDFFVSLGVSDGGAATVVGLLSIFNGLGRLCSGAFYDRFGLRKTQVFTSAVAILAPGMALAAVLLRAPGLGIAGLCLCGFSYGFSPTVSAAFSAGFYGTRHFALNFSVLNLVLIPASFVPALAGGLVTASGAYVSTFALLTALSCAGLFVNLSIKKA